MLAYIAGCAGTSLSADETAHFTDHPPWGLILFARNCEDPTQISELCAAFRACVGRADAPILIDQEGGRVQRLKPPRWPQYPPAARLGALYRADSQAGVAMAELQGQAIGEDLFQLGITVDCAPVADIPVAGAHDVIGDRAYGAEPVEIAALAGAFANGLMRAGVAPVVKHIPGHGRAGVDSHKALPRVSADIEMLRAGDFAPFYALRHLPMAMTAHIVYEAIDPDFTATQSPRLIAEIIRGEIGFDGLLMSDDIAMEALSGTLAERARTTIEAGCDVVLHCSGVLDATCAVAGAVPALTGAAARRAAQAFEGVAANPGPLDGDARAKLAFWAQESHQYD